jgi:hypothetical protein
MRTVFLPKGALRRLGAAEANGGGAVGGEIEVARGRGDVVLVGLEGAAANYLGIAGNLKSRLVAGIRSVIIGAPLPYVTGHI